jgi:hypothetical protein
MTKSEAKENATTFLIQPKNVVAGIKTLLYQEKISTRNQSMP